MSFLSEAKNLPRVTQPRSHAATPSTVVPDPDPVPMGPGGVHPPNLHRNCTAPAPRHYVVDRAPPMQVR